MPCSGGLHSTRFCYRRSPELDLVFPPTSTPARPRRPARPRPPARPLLPLLQDPTSLSADALCSADGSLVRRMFSNWPRDVPAQEERARLLRELGRGLAECFGGQAAQLVAAAQGSAVRLVQLVAAHFPGFRDHAVYRGRQVFFYKVCVYSTE